MVGGRSPKSSPQPAEPSWQWGLVSYFHLALVSPSLPASWPSFPISNSVWVPCLSPGGLSRPHPLLHFPTAPHLLSFPTLVCLVTTCSITHVQPVGSERARPKSGLFTVLLQRPSTRPGFETVLHGYPVGPRGHPPQGWALACAWAGRSLAPWAPPPARATPFTHQEKGTQQAIPTRSPAAQYNNSWGKWEGPGIQRKEWSGQRKNRRDCEKELWMKCEKQRHQSEENSSKPKRGTSISAHTHPAWGAASDHALTCSFIHSFHSPTTRPAKIS